MTTAAASEGSMHGSSPARKPSPRFAPLKPTPIGTLRPCGENTNGTVLEFFANPADLTDLLEHGITTTLNGERAHFAVRLTSTPYYMNGDAQIQAIRSDQE